MGSRCYDCAEIHGYCTCPDPLEDENETLRELLEQGVQISRHGVAADGEELVYPDGWQRRALAALRRDDTSP